jgi:hypothetical protein
VPVHEWSIDLDASASRDIYSATFTGWLTNVVGSRLIDAVVGVELANLLSWTTVSSA